LLPGVFMGNKTRDLRTRKKAPIISWAPTLYLVHVVQNSFHPHPRFVRQILLAIIYDTDSGRLSEPRWLRHLDSWGSKSGLVNHLLRI
jgi:hypothetical protein